MSYKAESIAVAVEKVNREYFLPAIQRPFVWEPEQIVALFDSLMKGYPISSFLFWQVLPENRENWQTYKFIENFRYGQTHNELVNPDGRSLTLVLDGQQRLTSLLIGLRGSYTVKMKNRRADNPNAWVKQWLYLDLLKEPITEDEESDLGVTYGFHFWPDAPAPTTSHFWLKVGKILDFNSEDKFDDFKDQLWDEVAGDTPKSKERVFRKNLDRLYRLVWKDEVIAYYTEKDQSYDRVLDIFVRANDGGTKLSKSDLLLSTFTSKWSGVNAREEIYDFVERLNGDLDRKNSFNKDLIMRACLVLSDLDTHYVTDNFTNKNLRIIEQNWPRIKKAIEYTVRLVNRFGFDRDTLTSSNALLPIAYYLFKTGPTLLDGETQFDVANADRIRRWLIIALLNGVFGGASSNTLRSARNILQEYLLASKDFPIGGLIEGLKDQAGHRAVIEGNDASGFLDTRYTSKTSFTALSLLYEERNWGTTLYHIDHIIPKSMCSPNELRKQDIPEALIPGIVEACDRIGNLQLLPASENVTKSNMPFSEWIRTRDRGFLERHMIPDDPDLWHPRALPDFVREREKMIQRRVLNVLSIDQSSTEGTSGNPLLAAV